MKIDLHVHTSFSSDAWNSPKAIVRHALRRGLAGVAVTDHNFIGGVARVRAAAPSGFIVIAGVEYSTDHGHILALFCEDFAEGFARDEKGRFALAEIAPFVKERGGVLICAHPFQMRAYLNENGELRESLFEHVHGLESMNSRALSRNADSEELTAAAANERGVFTTGGSDAHFPAEVGRCYTQFPADTAPTLPALRDALLRGECTAHGAVGRAWYRYASVFRYASRAIRKVRKDK